MSWKCKVFFFLAYLIVCISGVGNNLKVLKMTWVAYFFSLTLYQVSDLMMRGWWRFEWVKRGALFIGEQLWKVTNHHKRSSVRKQLLLLINYGWISNRDFVSIHVMSYVNIIKSKSLSLRLQAMCLQFHKVFNNEISANWTFNSCFFFFCDDPGVCSFKQIWPQFWYLITTW